MIFGLFKMENSVFPHLPAKIRLIQKGRVYIDYSVEYTCELLQCSKTTAKKIRKEGAMQTGALGNLTSNQSADYVTYVILGSKSHEADNYDPTMKELENIANACKVELEKKA